ncbi:LysE family translocator [Brevibacterium daeguense]|uniref:LysE family translocator n=1 Tax=Brevibacterium daeguense TaxID=909936 RepID=A0ABP8EGC7_9MICO|nr:LysE family transporter [Brevibacterium daeguense]
MTSGAWLVLLGTWLVAVASPGPDFLAVLRTSLSRGRGAGWAVAAGVTAGIAVWIAVALLGIVALVSSHPAAALVMRWAGVVFLVIYGGWILSGVVRELRRRARVAESPVGKPPAVQTVPTIWQSVRLGFLTNTVGNPKAVVFFGALFASILPPGITLAESVTVAAAMVLVAFLWFGLVAIIASRRVVVATYQRAQLWIDGFLGVFFVLLGILLIPWQGV